MKFIKWYFESFTNINWTMKMVFSNCRQEFEMVVISPEDSYEVEGLHSFNDSSNYKTNGNFGGVKKI